jgi:broad specificity phosphatase PhoE
MGLPACPAEATTYHKISDRKEPTVFFITHPNVAIDRAIPVPDWPLNDRGRARMRAMTAHPWTRAVRHIFASKERKACEAAQLLADCLGLDGYTAMAELGENDRSATGFLAEDEFEATADAFFARPQESIRGWERAADAQARIVNTGNITWKPDGALTLRG